MMNMGRVIGHPYRQVPNKLDLLYKAAGVGIKAPRTLVTSKKSPLVEFVKACNGNVITKNISKIALFADNDTF